MRGYAKQKVPGGKLVAVRLEYGAKIEKVEILGDFFIYPESALSDIENALLGLDIASDACIIESSIEKAAKKSGAEFVGITPEAIASTIRMAIA